MRQFDVYANPFASRDFAPFVTVISSHLIRLEAVVIAPLFADRTLDTAAEVAVSFEGASYILSLTDMASTAPAGLRHRRGDLSAVEDEIRRGLDRLFTGF